MRWIAPVVAGILASVMVGGALGNYRILHKLGEGGMGAVYLAEHALIGRKAAIKVLLREMSHRQELVTRFFNEARAAAAIKHPGIVEIYDFGYHDDGSAYIVMEYLQGESLSARLGRTGTIAEARAVALCRQIASALGAVHETGIVHRDLKPDNIYIVRDPDIIDGERTKILDFGIAKLSSGDLPGQSVTRTGMVIGTPPYMSPEACKGAGTVDHRADLYALGCILFEMLCGRGPFVADGGGEIMAQHIYAPVPPPSSFRSVTPQLEQVILRALVKEPALRFQSAEELSAALQIAVPPSGFVSVGMPESMVAATRPVPMPEPSWSPGASAPLPSYPATPPHAIASAAVQTTLSQASVVTLPATGRRRTWLLPAVAAVAIVSGVAIALGMRGLPQEHDPAATRNEFAKIPAPTSVSPATSSTPPTAPLLPPPVTRPSATPVPPRTVSPQSDTTAPQAASRITIRLTSDPAGAEVYRLPQEVHLGKTPLRYALDAIDGEIALLVKKHGYHDRRVVVAADRDREQSVALVKVVPAVPAQGEDSKTTGSPKGSENTSTSDPGTLNPFDKLDQKKQGGTR